MAPTPTRVRETVTSLVMLTAGAALAAFAVEEFLAPNDLLDGGVTGVAMMLAHVTGLPLGMLVAVLNIPFVAVAHQRLDRSFVARFAWSVAVFSVLTGVLGPLAEATADTFLALVYGGLFLGAGVGLVMRGGGCLDGTEVVAILANRRAHVSVGTVVLLINVAVFAAAGLVFGLDRGMYSLVMYFVTSKVIDVVEVGPNQTKAALVVCEDGRAVAERIYAELGRTVTFLRGSGLVSEAGKDVLYCVVTRAEVYELRRIVADAPGGAFSTISEVSEIVGEHVKSTAPGAGPR